LLALGVLYETLGHRPRGEKPTLQQGLTGVVLGAIGIAVMLTPWEFTPGVVFDTRSVLLSVSGLFLGTVPTLVAVLMTAAFRLYNGGAGAWTGVAVIVTSGSIGIAWRHLRRRELEDVSIRELYAMGVVVHIAMLLWMFSLPWSLARDVLSAISLPVMVIYPVGTALLGGLMANWGARKRAEEALREYSERLEERVEERTRELREAQEQLIRKEKLTVLGQLAAGVGHELRNPLGVISNAVYLLQMNLPDADETTRESLEMIAEEVRNAAKIISDLLDFSRTRLPEREEVAVSELVTEVLEKRPPPKEVEVVTQIAPDLPPVCADPRQMEQVLVNLVVNAYQAMKGRGRLTISAQVEDGQLALSIADTGCGISEEDMAKLFEPLFTTKSRGIGLGLATSKSLVEANGGSVEVSGKLGKGSTFTVRLPLASAGKVTRGPSHLAEHLHVPTRRR
jgi:signal transduction histidine kinase